MPFLPKHRLAVGLLALAVSFSGSWAGWAAARTPTPKSRKQTKPAATSSKKSAALTDSEISDWASLQYGSRKQIFAPLDSNGKKIVTERLRMPLSGAQRVCVNSTVRPAITAARAAEIRRDPYDFASDDERRALSRAAVACGFGGDLVMFRINDGRQLLLADVRTCLANAFSNWPLLTDHIKNEVFNLAFDDKELETWPQLKDEHAQIYDRCFTAEQIAVFVHHAGPKPTLTAPKP